MLADIVLGQHLRLSALLGLGLALGILLLSFGSSGLLLLDGGLLLSLLLFRFPKSDGSDGVGSSVAIILPAWQTTIDVPVFLLLESHLVGPRIHITPVIEKVSQHLPVIIVATRPAFHFESLPALVQIRKNNSRFADGCVCIYIFLSFFCLFFFFY